MFSNPRITIWLHVLGQVLAQTAVIEIVPSDYKPYFMALVAIIGVIISFADQSISKLNGTK